MTDIKTKVQEWLDSGKDYDSGILLLSKYCPQKALVSSLVNGEDNPQKRDKLLYELTKLAGLESEYKKRSSLVRKERKRVKENKAKDIAARQPVQSEKPESGEQSGNNEPPAGDLKKDKQTGDKPEDVIVDPHKEVTEKTVLKVVGSNENVPFNKLPLIIQEVIKQKGSLYRERDQLHDSLKSIPEDNKPENMESRSLIAANISHISERIDFLYHAQIYFEEHNGVPDESILNWDPEPAKPTPKVMDHSKLSDIEVKNRHANLRGNITKTKNMLIYQKTSKQDKPNPMPEGPKYDKYETKLNKLTFELKEIEKELGKRK